MRVGLERIGLVGRALRLGEAGLMVGFPALAGVLGMPPGEARLSPVLVAVLLAAVPLSLSIYAHNSLAGYHADRHDPKFRNNPFHRGEIGRGTVRSVLWVGAATGFLILAAFARWAVPWTAVLWGLWVAYSSPRGLKGRPGLATVHHVAAGALIFAIPYCAVRPIDLRGAVLAVFFGFALASGHANHEAIDEAADRASGVRTLAVVGGRRGALALNLALAAGAYLTLAAGWLGGVVEASVAAPFLLGGTLHLAAAVMAFSGRLEPGRYRTVYRTVFAAAALAVAVLHLAGGRWGRM